MANLSNVDKDDARTREMSPILRKEKVCIVVLGDIARSPRMTYHARSLAKEDFYVHMIGYGGTSLPKQLAKNRSIWIQFMREPPLLLQRIPRMISYPLKVAWQMVFLMWAFVWMLLRYQFYPGVILVQNPPAIPTLPLSYLFAKVVRARFVVDWHNYGHSLMAIPLGEKHPLVQVAKKVEDFFGSRADRHFCVTNAMRNDLLNRLDIQRAVTLYDRPPRVFRPLSVEERTEFLLNLSNEYPSLVEVAERSGVTNPSGRTGILVSSTSWTEDEDFGILLGALAEYEAHCRDTSDLYPNLIVFITGKGPQKEYYRGVIQSMKFEHVEIHLPWLEHADYPKLLACADLGVCLHYSSSGLDLPMKVVDMFGCGVPVCAYNFNCISELVKNNHNGFLFDSAGELSMQIQRWFRKYTRPNPQHKKLKGNLAKFGELRWHDNWKLNALPVLTYRNNANQ